MYNKTIVWITAALIGYAAYRLIGYGMRSYARKVLLKKEYDDIISGDEHKVKGRFEC